MFSHVMIGTNNLEKAKAFYDALLGTLDVRPAKVDGHRIFYITKTGVFSVSKPINGEPATPANGGTIGFACSSPGRPTPGMRPASPTAQILRESRASAKVRGKLYLAYLRDLDGNKICAMHRMAETTGRSGRVFSLPVRRKNASRSACLYKARAAVYSAGNKQSARPGEG
jgi:catechol 2,3-dioxygenase-like lactoylglutathione lyase family enzyme